MSGIQLTTSVLLAVAVGVSTAVHAGAADVDVSLRAELDRVAKLRIFFAHQSVGANLLEGINQLATTAGIPVRITAAATVDGVGPTTFGHIFIGENGKPLQKLRAFEHTFGPKPAGLDIALVKFCYLDFVAETDARALFSRYRATIDGLQARNPGTTFVHVTAPLTLVQGGPKAMLKWLLGGAPYGTIENVRREEYNALLRQTYRGREPLFDLARVESTAPDGTAVTVDWKGNVAPAMAPAYTDDSGHLNKVGKLRAARELISVLAAVPDRPMTSGRAAR